MHTPPVPSRPPRNGFQLMISLGYIVPWTLIASIGSLVASTFEDYAPPNHPPKTLQVELFYASPVLRHDFLAIDFPFLVCSLAVISFDGAVASGRDVPMDTECICMQFSVVLFPSSELTGKSMSAPSGSGKLLEIIRNLYGISISFIFPPCL